MLNITVVDFAEMGEGQLFYCSVTFFEHYYQVLTVTNQDHRFRRKKAKQNLRLNKK